MKDWFENTVDVASDFLVRANKFLSDPEHSIGGMRIFEWVVKTQSYVVFIKMSGLAASLLFGYLEARKLDFASAAGAAGGGRTLLHGFTRFVSSEGHAFSLNKTGVPALHVIVEGLQGMLHLAHTCWEMMGPVKTAQAYLLSEDKEDEEITSADELPPKQPLTEPLAAGVFVCADTVWQVKDRLRRCKWRGWVNHDLINRRLNEIVDRLKYFALFPNAENHGWKYFELHTGRNALGRSQLARLLGHDLQAHRNRLQLMPLGNGDKFSDTTNATWVFGDPDFNPAFLINRGVKQSGVSLKPMEECFAPNAACAAASSQPEADPCTIKLDVPVGTSTAELEADELEVGEIRISQDNAQDVLGTIFQLNICSAFAKIILWYSVYLLILLFMPIPPERPVGLGFVLGFTIPLIMEVTTGVFFRNAAGTERLTAAETY